MIRRPSLVLAALLLAALLLLTGCGGSDDGADSVRAATRGAEAAARTAMTQLTTYDYRTIDKDFAWVADGATRKFRSEFADASAPVRQVAVSMKATARGKVLEAATDYKDADHVVVLLFVDQTLTNPHSAQAQLEQLRLKASMVRQDGHWLVDAVEVVNRSAGGQVPDAG